MYSPLFSTYSQGENRVTSTIIAVLERLPFVIVEQILTSMIDQSDMRLLTFKNQPKVGDANSIPDAKISSSFSYWIETKTARDALGINQITNHLSTIDLENKKIQSSVQFLLILTPDDEKPMCLNNYEDTRVSWHSFEDLVLFIKKEILNPYDDNVSGLFIREQDRALLMELINFLVKEKLTDLYENKVQVIAAKTAWPDYKKLNEFHTGYSGYICQPNRNFQPAKYLAFYEGGVVHKIIPKVIYSIDEIIINQDGIKNKFDDTDFGNNFSAGRETLKNILNSLLEKIINLNENAEARSWWVDESLKLMLLSDRESELTIHLQNDITNNLKSNTGRTIPLTYGQPRYFEFDELQNAQTTLDLVSS